MRKMFMTFAFLVFFAGVSLAQRGTAEPDYYPSGYGGDTWTGKVTAVDENTREFTLSYTSGSKTQTFIGVLTKGYSVKMKDGKDYEIKMTDIMGMNIKAYYMTKTKKDNNGTKVKTNEVFKIKFVKEK